MDEKMMGRLAWVLPWCLTVALLPASVVADQPNLVILYADDAGYADFGFQPQVAEDMRDLTPHIDTICRDGARFSNAYMAGCVCSPSRAALMTGRYQSRFGFDNNLPPGTPSGLPLKETFVSKRLQQFGYRTALIGKWHLGYPARFQPNQRGWDWFYGCLQGSRSYFPIEKPHRHRVFLEDDRPTPEEGYITDRIGDAACQFIDRNRDQPFFLFVSFTAPHGPLQPKPDVLERVSHIRQAKRRKYAGLIVSLDDNVGKILAAVDRNRLRENTVVLFTNDNGGQTQTGAVNDPLRGRKGMLFEGGIRVPWVMRWPKSIQAGSVVDDPVIAIDILPTMIAAAGGRVDTDWQLDGVNLLPRLTGRQDELEPRSLYWRTGGTDGTYAIRDGHWKMIVERSGDRRRLLFDLSVDIGESKNVASDHPDRVQKLQEKLDRWASGLVRPQWGPGSRSERNSKRRDRSSGRG